MIRSNTPLEEDEQAVFVTWLEYNNLKFSAIPNSTYTKSWSQKRKNHKVGLRPGLPDLLILVPGDRATDGISKIIFLEMKRQSGGVLSKDQKEWIDAINGLKSTSITAVVCKGTDEAVKFMQGQIKGAVHGIFVLNSEDVIF